MGESKKTPIILSFPSEYLDVVTMLAVFEHLGESRERMASEIFRILKHRGTALLTVPGASVDHILELLVKLRLVDGMSFEEHGHFDSAETVGIFEKCGFRLLRWSKFQLGLNSLFIFEKP